MIHHQAHSKNLALETIDVLRRLYIRQGMPSMAYNLRLIDVLKPDVALAFVRTNKNYAKALQISTGTIMADITFLLAYDFEMYFERRGPETMRQLGETLGLAETMLARAEVR